MPRIKLAARLLEERYAAYKTRPHGSQSKEVVLTFLALGLADELLQMKMKEERTRRRLEELLAKIEKSI